MRKHLDHHEPGVQEIIDCARAEAYAAGVAAGRERADAAERKASDLFDAGIQAKRRVAAAEQARAEVEANVRALIPAECWISRTEVDRCTDYVSEFTEDMCCLPCRLRAALGREATP